MTNFYLTFIRYPLYRIRGGKKRDYRFVSGFPIIGSLSILLSLGFVQMPVYLRWFGAVCAILDTGGLHWFLVVMVYESRVNGKRE